MNAPSYVLLTGLLAAVGLAGCSADPQTSVRADSGSSGTTPAPPPGLDIPEFAEIATTDTVSPGPSDVADDVASPPKSDATPGPDTHADADGDSEPVGPGVSPRACVHRFTYTPPPGDTPTAVFVPGAFNNWDENALAMTSQSDGSWNVDLELASLSPGSYGYKIRLAYADGSDDWRLDPSNKMRRFDDGFVNSKLLVPDCGRPELELLKRSMSSTAGTVSLEVAVHSGVAGQLDDSSPTATHNGVPIAGAWSAERGSLLVELSGLPPGKHTFRFDATAAIGAAIPLVTSFWVEEVPFGWRDAVLYFAFVDRFNDADPSGQPLPCTAADPLGNWLGGDWPGITEKIESGYFDQLGVNTLWLNAPMDNPDECVLGIGGYTYTAYHGYFPSDLYAPEEHFGSLDDLKALIRAAHARGIRVLVDLVVNHVYQTAAEWKEHEFDGWFNTPIYVCGWEQPETCWFRDYLPDFDFRNDQVVEHLTEAALWWVKEIDVDGFRVDAVKHVHPHVLQTLRSKLDRHIEAFQDVPFWTVGETFVGSWGGGSGDETVIKAYISDDQLYGQFDFPLYWATLSTLGRRESPMTALKDVLEGVTSYFDGALMSSFLGNHDVPRYISHANGDIGDMWGNGATEQGWNNPPAQPTDDEPYSRLEMAFAFIAAGPWVPLIYYGDEVGIAGAGDPDNRRMMPWSGLSMRQESVRTTVGKLMAARKANRALRRGDLQVDQATDDTMVIVRTDIDSQAVAVFNIGNGPVTLSVSVNAGAFTDAETGESLTATTGTLDVLVGPGQARLLTTVP